MKTKHHLIQLCLLTAGLLALAPAVSTAQSITIFTTSSPPPPEGGTTSGDGTYQIGTQVWLVASNNSCWMCTNWVDNSGSIISSNPCLVTVSLEITNYTAFFVPQSCQITAGWSPPDGGTSTGSGSYLCGSNVVLTAIKNNPCYMFTNWNDGSTDNPHVVIASGDATYTANFAQEQFAITTKVAPPNTGTTTGDTTTNCGASVVLEAFPDPCWIFTNWSDGSMDNPHTITASGDAAYTANFVQRQFTITTKVAPSGSGTTTGDTTTNCGAIVTVTAIPNVGDKFLNWSERLWVFGSSPPLFTTHLLSTSAKYSFVAGGSKDLTANFDNTNHPCTYSISPTSSPLFLEPGGGGTVHVYTSSGCDWTYGNVSSHIHILGVTANSLTYAVDPLPTIYQVGGHQIKITNILDHFTIKIAGQNFTVLQNQQIVTHP